MSCPRSLSHVVTPGHCRVKDVKEVVMASSSRSRVVMTTVRLLPSRYLSNILSCPSWLSYVVTPCHCHGGSVVSPSRARGRVVMPTFSCPSFWSQVVAPCRGPLGAVSLSGSRGPVGARCRCRSYVQRVGEPFHLFSACCVLSVL